MLLRSGGVTMMYIMDHTTRKINAFYNYGLESTGPEYTETSRPLILPVMKLGVDVKQAQKYNI